MIIIKYEEFVKENKIEDKSEDEKNLELIVSIIKIKGVISKTKLKYKFL